VTTATAPTWRRLWLETTDALGGTPEAAVEARWMCQVASGRDGADWLLGLDDLATTRPVSRLDAMVGRRKAFENPQVNVVSPNGTQYLRPMTPTELEQG